MSRIRTIKPEFWSSEQIVSCSKNARLLFIGIWNFCDDGGVHPASYARLKMEVFPADSDTQEDIKILVEELIKVGLLIQFEVNNKKYWSVTGWSHQKIDKPTFRFPNPHSCVKFDEYSTSPPLGLVEPSGTEGKGREGKGIKIYDPTNLSENKKIEILHKPKRAMRARIRRDGVKKQFEISLPDFVHPERWSEFVQHRKEIKKPLTELAAKKTITQLEKMFHDGQDPNEILDQSIRNGWQGIFGLKNNLRRNFYDTGINKPNGREIVGREYDEFGNDIDIMPPEVHR